MKTSKNNAITNRLNFLKKVYSILSQNPTGTVINLRSLCKEFNINNNFGGTCIRYGLLIDNNGAISWNDHYLPPVNEDDIEHIIIFEDSLYQEYKRRKTHRVNPLSKFTIDEIVKYLENECGCLVHIKRTTTIEWKSKEF